VNVKELIAKLEKLDPDLPVVYGTRRCGQTVQVIYTTVPQPQRVVLS
jgi:hypothetical protein